MRGGYGEGVGKTEFRAIKRELICNVQCRHCELCLSVREDGEGVGRVPVSLWDVLSSHLLSFHVWEVAVCCFSHRFLSYVVCMCVFG